MNGTFQHLAQLVARTRADLLYACPTLAQEYGALSVALNVNGLLHPHAAVGSILPLVGLDRSLVGKFLVQLEKHLLARDFGCEQTQRQIGGLILGYYLDEWLGTKPWMVLVGTFAGLGTAVIRMIALTKRFQQIRDERHH